MNQPMLLATRLQTHPEPATVARALPLPLDQAARQRARQRLELDDGQVLAIALPVGSTLKPGDLLQIDGGWHPGFVIQALPQTLLQARCEDPLTLTRIAWHLGNRHCRVQIERGRLLLEPDPVLAELLRALGATVDTVEAPYTPEGGAYGGGHKHGHDQTFDEDYALAQATFSLHERAPTRPAVLAPGSAAGHG